MLLRRIAFFAALVVCSTPTWSEVIDLKDGRRFVGTITTEGAKSIIVTENGGRLEVPTDSIYSIREKSGATAVLSDEAATEWKRVMPAVKRADELQQSIALLENFLKRYPASPFVAEAKTTLDKYRRWADEGALKYRGEWLGQTELAAMRAGWQKAAQGAISHYNACRYNESLAAAKVVAAADPANADALAIAGLSAYRLGQSTLAIKYFTDLESAGLPSPLAENNLAALCFEGKRYPEGLRFYTRAMQFAADSPTILNNVNEALNHPKVEKKSEACQALLRVYEPARLLFEARMEREGKVRWGSEWLPRMEVESRKGKLEAVRQQMKDLEVAYGKQKRALEEAERQLKIANSDVQNAQVALTNAGASAYADRSITRVSLESAQQTYNRAVERQRAAEDAKSKATMDIATAEAQAKPLKEKFESLQPHFTGVHRMMELADIGTQPPPATQAAAK